MLFVVIIALHMVAALLSAKSKKSMPVCFTMAFSGLVLLMYVLAFFRGLKMTGALAVFAMVFVIGVSVREGKDFFFRLIKKFFDPGVILFEASALLVGVATSAAVFTWWDDINFWSSDAKQLFFINGFPGRYGNVSPEFGDYPPVTSLVKWLFLQASPSNYVESLQFAGYYFLNGVFLLPLFDRFGGFVKRAARGRLISGMAFFASFVGVMLLPGVFNGIIYYGTPADITMAIVYGALLLTMMDDGESSDFMYFTEIALYSSVLLLTKSVGFEWAAFALIFYGLFGRRKKTVVLPVLFAGASLSSWLLFCLVNRRVAKLTGAGLRMATSGNYVAPDNTADKLRFFFEGFWLQPMHADHNLTFDISTGAAVVLIFLSVFVLYRTGILDGKELKKITAFFAITGIVAYGIVFAAHITIFQTEDQYLDAYAMAVSIARYCAPFALGAAYLVMGLLLDRVDPAKGTGAVAALVGCLLFIYLTADYRGVYTHLMDYREALAYNESYVSDMVGDDGRAIVSAVSDEQYWGKRVLVLRDGHQYYWVHNTYISKEASPVALVYDSFIVGEDTADTVMEKLQNSHAEYFYVEDKDGSSGQLFYQVMKDGEFEAGKVYRIEENVY